MHESGYLGRIPNCSEVPNPPPPYTPWDTPPPRQSLRCPPKPAPPTAPPSRPPKVFAPGWGIEFEQAAPSVCALLLMTPAANTHTAKVVPCQFFTFASESLPREQGAPHGAQACEAVFTVSRFASLSQGVPGAVRQCFASFHVSHILLRVAAF